MFLFFVPVDFLCIQYISWNVLFVCVCSKCVFFMSAFCQDVYKKKFNMGCFAKSACGICKLLRVTDRLVFWKKNECFYFCIFSFTISFAIPVFYSSVLANDVMQCLHFAICAALSANVTKVVKCVVSRSDVYTQYWDTT